MQKIKQVSTVVDNTPSPAQEKKKLESEQLKQLEKVIDAYEKKVTEEVLNKTEPKKEEELPIEEIDDSYYYDDMGVKRPNMYSNKIYSGTSIMFSSVYGEKLLFLHIRVAQEDMGCPSCHKPTQCVLSAHQAKAKYSQNLR